MARNLREITLAYWRVGKVLRSPDAMEEFTNQEAFKLLNRQDYLRDTDWRLKTLMHTIKYDIIEGNTKWRGNPQGTNTASIHHMKEWTSTVPSLATTKKKAVS